MSNRVDLLRHDKPKKTCRDCYHWMACKTMLEALGFVVDGDGKDADKRCDEFQAAADVAPVVHGRWECSEYDFSDYWRCSACGEDWFFEYDPTDADTRVNYCPTCGARMDLKEGENDGAVD